MLVTILAGVALILHVAVAVIFGAKVIAVFYLSKTKTPAIPIP
jgi:hypothetical protein